MPYKFCAMFRFLTVPVVPFVSKRKSEKTICPPGVSIRRISLNSLMEFTNCLNPSRDITASKVFGLNLKMGPFSLLNLASGTLLLHDLNSYFFFTIPVRETFGRQFITARLVAPLPQPNSSIFNVSRERKETSSAARSSHALTVPSVSGRQDHNV